MLEVKSIRYRLVTRNASGGTVFTNTIDVISYLSKDGVVIPVRNLEKSELRVSSITVVAYRRICKPSIKDKDLQGSPAYDGHDEVYPDHLDDSFAA